MAHTGDQVLQRLHAEQRRERRATRALFVMWALAALLGYAVAGWHWQGAAAAAGVSYGGLIGLMVQQHILGREVMEEHPFVMCLPWAILAGVVGGVAA